MKSESITTELITGNDLVVPANRGLAVPVGHEIVAEIVDDSFCRNCGRPIEIDDNFCGRCGQFGGREGECRTIANVAPPSIPSQSNSLPQSNNLQLVEGVLGNRFAVLGLIATLGPLGLVALWVSPSFSSPTKTIWTLGYLLVAVVLPIAIAIYWLDYSVRPLVDVLGR